MHAWALKEELEKDTEIEETFGLLQVDFFDNNLFAIKLAMRRTSNRQTHMIFIDPKKTYNTFSIKKLNGTPGNTSTDTQKILVMIRIEAHASVVNY